MRIRNTRQPRRVAISVNPKAHWEEMLLGRVGDLDMYIWAATRHGERDRLAKIDQATAVLSDIEALLAKLRGSIAADGKAS